MPLSVANCSADGLVLQIRSRPGASWKSRRLNVVASRDERHTLQLVNTSWILAASLTPRSLDMDTTP